MTRKHQIDELTEPPIEEPADCTPEAAALLTMLADELIGRNVCELRLAGGPRIAPALKSALRIAPTEITLHSERDMKTNIIPLPPNRGYPAERMLLSEKTPAQIVAHFLKHETDTLIAAFSLSEALKPHGITVQDFGKIIVRASIVRDIFLASSTISHDTKQITQDAGEMKVRLRRGAVAQIRVVYSPSTSRAMGYKTK